MIKTALLTIGNSPMSDALIRALAKHSQLECLVYSKRKRRVSLFRRIREYGLRYSLQALAGNAWRAVSATLDPQDPAAAGVIVWDDNVQAEDILKQLDGVDMLVCCLFNRLLDSTFIDSFDYCINLHPSLLPDYRGPEPIYWGLLNREAEFGLTLHHMTESLDEGDIISQSRCERPRLPLVYLVEKKLASSVDEAIRGLMEQVARGQLQAEAQAEGFYLPAPTLENIRKYRSGLPG